jgi:Domain of unknown function (DUF5668)
MNNRGALFAQAIRGPVLLITIGLLFAMHQAGVLHFSRTWPLIIIVIGVLKLIERLAIPQAPSTQVGGPPR